MFAVKKTTVSVKKDSTFILITTAVNADQFHDFSKVLSITLQ